MGIGGGHRLRWACSLNRRLSILSALLLGRYTREPPLENSPLAQFSRRGWGLLWSCGGFSTRPLSSEQRGEGELEGMICRCCRGELLLPLTRQGEFPWFPLGLMGMGRQGPEEAVVPAGGGEGHLHSRGDGEAVVVGGEARPHLLQTIAHCWGQHPLGHL